MSARTWSHQPSAGNHHYLVYDDLTGRDVAIECNFNKANADLMAAAPELLAALRDLIAALPASSSRTPRARWNAEAVARAAIAKAEGRDY